MASAYKEPPCSARIASAIFQIHEIGGDDPVGEELTDDKPAWRATLVAAEIRPSTDDPIYVIRINTECK